MVPQTRSTGGAVYNLNYHLVWCPKYRKPILLGPVAFRCGELLKEIASKWGFFDYRSGGYARSHSLVFIRPSEI